MTIDITKKKLALILGSAALVTAGIAGGAVAFDDDDDRRLTGTELRKATDAALAETGGGRVTDSEKDDEESWYEVEVTLDDGTQVDVQLDESFTVVSTERDGRDDHDDDSDDREDD